MNASTKNPEQRIVKVTSGFFYRTNMRGQPGLNWGRDGSLPSGIRMCPHAINLGRHFIENLPMDATVEAKIWQEHPGGVREYKGKYTIPATKLVWWTTKNGYYQAHSGTYWLAVPVSLWEEIETAAPKVPDNQRKLF